jgi:hypothetical protein
MRALPSPDFASRSASESLGHVDLSYIAYRIPVEAHPSVSFVTVWSLVTGSG